MYPDYMNESLKKVIATRQKRFEIAKSGNEVFPPMSAEEREDVLNKFHPDYKPESRKEIHIGPNKGEILTAEVSDMLESQSRIRADMMDLDNPDYETDILIVGGGGAGCAAAITASQKGAKSIISTKLRIGDANSMMSQGGMQAAVAPQDSPTRHYLDALGGGHFDNKPNLVEALGSCQVAGRSGCCLGQKRRRLHAASARRRHIPQKNAFQPGLHGGHHPANAYG